MALFDETIDETIAVSDSRQVSAEYGIGLSDVLSLDADLLALASVYQQSLLDSLSLSDSASIVMSKQSLAIDNVTVSDAVSLQVSYHTTVSSSLAVTDAVYAGLVKTADLSVDTVSASDSIVAGLERDCVLSDTLSVSDVTATSAAYNVKPSDVVVATDFAFTWTDGSLSANLSGSSAVTAVLIKKAPLPGIVAAPPSRTVVLPKPPLEPIHHVVVNSRR